MPKKEKNQKKAMDEDELSELLQQSLKKKSDEEEGLTEEAETSENIDLEALELHQFINPSTSEDSGAPVLEKIAGSQAPRPIFVGGIPQTTGAVSEENGGDEFKYMPSTNQPGEATYTGSTHIDTETERVDFSRVGRERSELRGWESWGASERLSAREQSFSNGGIERTGTVRSFDTSIAGRSKEREEIKYEKYNPKKLPSGR